MDPGAGETRHVWFDVVASLCRKGRPSQREEREDYSQAEVVPKEQDALSYGLDGDC